jgi:hypothetical protein
LACLMNVCASIALTALWFQHSQIKSRFHHHLPIWCDWEILHHLCGITLKNVKAEVILCILCTPMIIFGTYFVQNLWRPSPTVIISWSAWNLCKFTQRFRNCEALSYTNFLVNTLNRIITHNRCLTTSLSILNIYSPFFGHSTPLSYSSFTHYILAINHTWFVMDFYSTPVFSMKKVDNSTNLTAGRIINHRAHHNSLYWDKNKH